MQLHRARQMPLSPYPVLGPGDIQRLDSDHTPRAGPVFLHPRNISAGDLASFFSLFLFPFSSCFATRWLRIGNRPGLDCGVSPASLRRPRPSTRTLPSSPPHSQRQPAAVSWHCFITPRSAIISPSSPSVSVQSDSSLLVSRVATSLALRRNIVSSFLAACGLQGLAPFLIPFAAVLAAFQHSISRARHASTPHKHRFLPLVTLPSTLVAGRDTLY